MILDFFSKDFILASNRVICILISFQQNFSNFFKFLSTPRKQTGQAKFQSNGLSTPDIDLTFSSHNGSVHPGQSSTIPDQLKLGVSLKEAYIFLVYTGYQSTPRR